MIEAVGIAAICIGAVALVTSGITAVAVAYSPSVSSSQSNYEINEAEYQERLRVNYSSVYMHSGFGGYPRTVLWKSTIDT